ncbi:MucR family transcriptional regulator [Brevirhabdus sp.]|uniref:MucR family transcriptional regulator n=1 Tax=Brevirhabdus sp. TaxID=2004514 RepID=UPI00405973AA
MDTSDSQLDTIGRIVASFAARSDVGADDIVNLYRKLRGEAGQLPQPASASAPDASGEDRPQPALPVARAVSDDKVYCLCCGRGFKMLKRHLGAEHGMTEAQYRARFNLPESVPLVAPSYSRKKASYARDSGFGKYDRNMLADQG